MTFRLPSDDHLVALTMAFLIPLLAPVVAEVVGNIGER